MRACSAARMPMAANMPAPLAQAVRRPVLGSVHRHYAAHRLHHEVEAGAIAVRPGLPEARDRAIDETGVERGEGVEAESQPGRRPRLEVLDEQIGAARE